MRDYMILKKFHKAIKMWTSLSMGNILDVTLDFKPGFDRYDDDWECTACGAHLHHSYSSD